MQTISSRSPPPFEAMDTAITEARVRAVVEAWTPPTSSLRIALDMHARATEGHLLFGWATHVGLVSAIIGGKLSDGRLFPGGGVSGSLWTILVGPSARSRKSTSLQIQYDLAHATHPDGFLDRPGSPEALLSDLGSSADRCLYLPELGDYFAQARRGRLATVNELLVKLFDGKTERVSYKRGEIVIKNPRISLLGGVTPAFLVAHTTPHDWRGGFFSRALIFATKPERELRLPTPDASLAEKLQLCFDTYARIFRARGVRTPAPVALTAEAEAIWLTWHDEIAARLSAWTHHEALAAILGRASLQTAKLALLHAAICRPERLHSLTGWWLGAEEMSLAVAMCDLHLRSAVACAIRTYDTADARDKALVLQALASARAPVTLGLLCKQTDLLLDRAGKILATLEAQGDAHMAANGTWALTRTLPVSGAADIMDLL